MNGKFRKSQKWFLQEDTHRNNRKYIYVKNMRRTLFKRKEKKLIRKIRTSQGIELNL